MTTPRARIVRGPRVDGAPLLSPAVAPSRQRRIVREELEARLSADRIVEAARARAEELTARARERAVRDGEELARVAREEGEARGLARWIRLHEEEMARLESAQESVIGLAVVLAERLLGAALELRPERIADLARAALAEARGARRVVLHAHPLDSEALRRHLQAAAVGAQAVEVRDDAGLARGALRLQTEVGTIDAQLSPRLERLAAALRDALS
jgi:flagellar biosynthesis/type III secretory pathway protein FliH